MTDNADVERDYWKRIFIVNISVRKFGQCPTAVKVELSKCHIVLMCAAQLCDISRTLPELLVVRSHVITHS